MSTERSTAPVGLPRELLGAIPRDVELTSGGRATLAVAAAFVVAAVVSAVLMSLAYMSSERRRALRENEGVFTNAAVTRITFSSGDDGRRRTVTYVYEVAGRSYVSRQRLRNSDHRVVAEGGPIEIGFLSSEPQTSWVQGYEDRGFPLFVMPFISLALLATAVGVVGAVQRQRTILSEGRATLARVVAQKKTGGSHSHRGYRVTCEFKTLNGAQQTASYDTGSKPPTIGAIVPILYHRDHPKRTSAYPVPLVRTVRRPESRELVN